MRLLFALLLATTAFAQDVHVRVDPHGPGGADSSTDYTSIQQALDHAPETAHGRVVISIVPGVYHERLVVTRNRPHITLLGLGGSPAEVVITGSQNAKSAGGTFLSATVEVDGDGFEADNVTFENAAPPPGSAGGQAVAIAVRSDRAVFKRCSFLGDQDTLFADFGRQYYVDSYIRGGVDFIFGNATAVFEHDEIEEIRPGYLTAQSRTDPTQTTGYVIDHSKVVSSIDPAGNKGFYLGRPWRLYSRVVVMHTELPAALDPAGWSVWHAGDAYPPKAYYAEFANTGPGAGTAHRAEWSHQLTAAEAKAYEPHTFLRGADGWDPVVEAAKLP